MPQSQRQLCLEESELEDIGRVLLSYALKDAEGVTVCEQDGPRINYDGFSLVCPVISFHQLLCNDTALPRDFKGDSPAQTADQINS